MGYLETVLADRPLLLWPMDEGGGTRARDVSGNGRHGTYNGIPVLRGGPSIPGHAAPRFGSSRYVESAASITLGTAYALEVWFEKVTHLGGMPGDINSVIGDLFSTGNGALVRYDGTGTLRLYYASSGGFRTIGAVGLGLPSHRRPSHLVASVRASGRARLILNGKTVEDAATVGTVSGYSGNMRVARSEDGRWFDGSAGWAAVYNTELTPDQARRHYDAGMRELADRRRLRR